MLNIVIFAFYLKKYVARSGAVVEALLYKLEDGGIDSQ
jgi:hypothetical protein